MKTTQKMLTLDQVCNQPAGAFQQHLVKKEKFLQDQEQKRAKRIRSAQEAKTMSWAA